MCCYRAVPYVIILPVQTSQESDLYLAVLFGSHGGRNIGYMENWFKTNLNKTQRYFSVTKTTIQSTSLSAKPPQTEGGDVGSDGDR